MYTLPFYFLHAYILFFLGISSLKMGEKINRIFNNRSIGIVDMTLYILVKKPFSSIIFECLQFANKTSANFTLSAIFYKKTPVFNRNHIIKCQNTTEKRCLDFNDCDVKFFCTSVIVIQHTILLRTFLCALVS